MRKWKLALAALLFATQANAQTISNGVPISGLPKASALTGGETVIGIQSGVTRQFPLSLLAGEVNVNAYGATTAQTDISTSITLAMAAAKSLFSNAFGAVYFSASDAYALGSTVTVPQSMAMDGCSAGVQSLNYTALTAAPAFNLSGEFPRINCFILSNSNSNPALTAANAVKVGTSSSSWGDPGATLRDLSVHGYDTPIFLYAGAYQRLDGLLLQNFGSYGARIDNSGNCDAGDATITGLTTVKNSGSGIAGVYWRGSGGSKFVGNKWLGSIYGLYAEPRDDGGTYLTACNTQDILVTATSVENQTGAGIVASAKTHSALRFPVFSTIQMANVGIGIYFPTVTGYVGGTTADIGGSGAAYVGYPASVQSGYVGGNVIAQAGVGVQLENGANGIVVGLSAYGARTVGSGTNGATYGAGAPSVFMTPDPLWDKRVDFNEAGYLDFRDKQQAYGVTSNAAYTNVYQITIPANRGGRFKIVIEGNVTIGGVLTEFYREDTFSVTANGSGVPTVLPLDSDRQGATIDVQKITSGTNVQIGLKNNVASGSTLLNAMVTLLPEGKFAKLTRL